MSKIDQNFPYEIYRFLHKALRVEDQKVDRFLERFLIGPQAVWEKTTRAIQDLVNLHNPDLCRDDLIHYLKDIVGLTKELDSITSDISDDDLRRLISLAVPLWREKGLEVGYRDIVRLFTGKNSRTFNWFDYRFIAGEVSFAQDELGEDAWLISEPGVARSTPTGNVVGLWPFEGDFSDRSSSVNDGELFGKAHFYGPGALTGSDRYLHLSGDGVVGVPRSAVYDLSGSFTVEMMVRTRVSQASLLFTHWEGSRGLWIMYRSDTNQLVYLLSDGVHTVTEEVAIGPDLDDNAWRHVGLIVDRDAGISRLYLAGGTASPGAPIGDLGDISNGDRLWIGGQSTSTMLFNGDIDAVRLSLSAQYDVADLPIFPSSHAHVEYVEEQLDEFYTDIRVVDEGDLNRTLVKRILNLMRPPSERLRVVYISFFESFESGKGDLRTISPGSYLDGNHLVLPAGAIEYADTRNSDTFSNIVLQTRFKTTGNGRYGIRFLVQDSLNYYEWTIDTGT